jgi:hypothetical protein
MGDTVLSTVFFPFILMAILVLTWGLNAAGSPNES